MKYTSIDVEFDDDEKEFNWWTKYYGYKYQEVVKCLYLSKYELYNTYILHFYKCDKGL